MILTNFINFLTIIVIFLTNIIVKNKIICYNMIIKRKGLHKGEMKNDNKKIIITDSMVARAVIIGVLCYGSGYFIGTCLAGEDIAITTYLPIIGGVALLLSIFKKEN